MGGRKGAPHCFKSCVRKTSGKQTKLKTERSSEDGSCFRKKNPHNVNLKTSRNGFFLQIRGKKTIVKNREEEKVLSSGSDTGCWCRQERRCSWHWVRLTAAVKEQEEEEKFHHHPHHLHHCTCHSLRSSASLLHLQHFFGSLEGGSK